MTLYVKIGTHSQSVISLGFKRNLPKVGDKIKFRSFPPIHREKWKEANVDEIRDVGYPLYFLSLR